VSEVVNRQRKENERVSSPTTITPERAPAEGIAPPEPAAVTLQNVSHRYGENVAVDDVSFSVRPGEFLTLLGASGSGKTTTLSMIAGFVTPGAGSITIHGRDVTRVPPQKRNVGLVFQNYALFPHMTVAQNVAFPLKLRRTGKDEARRRVEEALAMVRLEEFGGRYPRQLSGGQQQRVALARALVYRPPVLLMDEPFGALDRKLRREMQLELRELHREINVTVLFVTHDQEEALTLSDRIALMRNGKVVQLDAPERIYDDPLDPYVLDFVGDSNFLGGVCEADGATVVTDAGCRITVPAGAAPAGARVQWAIRPERVRLLADEAVGGYDNVLRVEVEDAIFLGNAIRYVLRLPGGEPLTATDANVGAVRRSGTVAIGWHSEDAVVLPARDDA
jgi:spermidine/putrescine ABC transporter ATP-binding subunit